MRRHPTLDIVLGELAAVNIKPTVIRNGHFKVRWSHAGHQRTCVVASSSASRHAPRDACACVRRQPRMDGLL
jgi:hypothetical protein